MYNLGGSVKTWFALIFESCQWCCLCLAGLPSRECGLFFCVGFKISWLCGLVFKTIRPTDCVDSSWFIVNYVVVVFQVFVVLFRVCSTTAHNSKVFLSAFSLFFKAIQLKTLVYIVSWFLKVMACGFGCLRIWFCNMLRHSVHLEFIKSFQTAQLLFFLEVCYKLFIQAIHKMGRSHWLFWLRRNFGM